MRNEGIQKDRVRRAGNLKKNELLRGGLRIQDNVKRRTNREGDQALHGAHHHHQNDAAGKQDPRKAAR